MYDEDILAKEAQKAPLDREATPYEGARDAVLGALGQLEMAIDHLSLRVDRALDPGSPVESELQQDQPPLPASEIVKTLGDFAEAIQRSTRRLRILDERIQL